MVESKHPTPKVARLTHASLICQFNDDQKMFDYFRTHFGAGDLDCASRLDGDNFIRSLNCGDLTLGFSSFSTSFRIPSGRLPSLLLTFNASGQTLFRIDGQLQRPSAGKGLLLSTPGMSDSLRYVRSPGEGNFIKVDGPSLLRVAKAMNGPLAMHLLQERLTHALHYTPFDSYASAAYAHSVMQSLRLVDGLLASGQPLPRALCLDDLIQRQLVLMLCPEFAEEALPGHEPGSEQRFSALLEWLQAHRHEPITLTAMEQRSGYSRRSLQKMFQKRFQCGPMQWLRRSRLELALEQLTWPQPGDTVTTIAHRCGYINLASFSRDFHAAHGRRPSDLLRGIRES